jgi:hypothetical protein
MFSKHNIQSIRFSNPQNDTVHIVYEDNGANTNYWFPVIPYNSYEWSIVREAGYDMESIFRNTLEWAKTHEPVEQVVKSNEQFTKLSHSVTINDNKTTVKIHDVLLNNELDLFITKPNNPTALLQMISVSNTQFDVDNLQGDFSVYLVN